MPLPPKLMPPPQPFFYKTVRCPACKHGIDPHGLDPGGICGVGDGHGALCQCLWSPNDIAAHLIGKYNLDVVVA